MDEELISFELAKKAKSAGFNRKVNHFYYWDGVMDCGDGDFEDMCLNHNLYKNFYSAPKLKEYKEWINTKNNDNCRNRTSSRKNRWLFL